MKRETTDLTINDKAIIYGFVDTGKFGDCIQDKYLIELFNLLSGRDLPKNTSEKFISGMIFPELLHDNSYKFVENYRQIADAFSKEKIVYAYFDYPIQKSALYVGTFDNSIRYSLLKAVSFIAANYKTTQVDITPLTIKIHMDSYAASTYSSMKSISSLEYITDMDEIKYPEQLFDVIDKSQRSNIIYSSR